jgi:hypothetical protein
MWIPKHILCVVGNWTSLEQVREIVSNVGKNQFSIDEEYSLLEPDDRMPNAFESCRDRARATWTDEDRALVKLHTAVVYVMSTPVLAQRAESMSATALQVIAALLNAGGSAAKAESAGIAHSRQEWLRLAQALTGASEIATQAIVRDAFVRQPLLDSDDDAYYSCGMHLLGHRDVEMPAELDALVAVDWFRAATAVILRQTSDASLQDQAVSLDEEQRFLTDGGPCSRYQQDDFFYNPYGYWALLENDNADEDSESAADELLS